MQEDLGIKEHVNNLMLLCYQRTYLITQLKRQGLPQEQLQHLFDAIIVPRLLYAAPEWPGYLSSVKNCLQSVLDKAKRWKLICHQYNVVDLLDKCARTLFKSSVCLSHSLNNLFPYKRHHTHLMSLRPRGHDNLSLNICSRVAPLLTVHYLRLYDFYYFECNIMYVKPGDYLRLINDLLTFY